MSTVQGRLRIAVQKSGRLADRSLDLVRDAGLRVVKGNNDLLYKVENYPIDLLRVRDDDIPTFVADGVCDLGIVGENVLEEDKNGGANAEIVMPLGFGRCTLKLAVPPMLDYAGPHSLQGQRIATSYPKILRRFLNDQGVQADIVVMRGAVEVAPRLKLSAAICDLVQRRARGVEHDVFRALRGDDARHPLDDGVEQVLQAGLGRGGRLDQDGLAIQHRLLGDQAVGFQRRAGRDQIADGG